MTDMKVITYMPDDEMDQLLRRLINEQWPDESEGICFVFENMSAARLQSEERLKTIKAVGQELKMREKEGRNESEIYDEYD